MQYSSIISLFLISILAASCEEKSLYNSLTESEYIAFKANDTVINTPKLLVTCTGNAGSYNDMETILVRKATNEEVDYFKLAPDVYFENNSTLIEYQGFFSSGEDGPFQKNGIWVYTDFYKETFHSGMRFAVDSMPSGYNDVNRPANEGIYFYEHGSLKRISKTQSDEAFQKFGKDGFYFIPNSGRFFKRHSVDMIE